MTREEREDVIDIIQSILDKYEENECLVTEITIGDEDIKAFKMAIEALEQEPRWISVSERLPKPYEQVLRTVKSIGWNGTFHIHVDLGSICPMDTDVIAWMPLPEPYEPQESEE